MHNKIQLVIQKCSRPIFVLNEKIWTNQSYILSVQYTKMFKIQILMKFFVSFEIKIVCYDSFTCTKKVQNHIYKDIYITVEMFIRFPKSSNKQKGLAIIKKHEAWYYLSFNLSKYLLLWLFHALKNYLCFSLFPTQKVARKMKLTYFFTPLMPFSAQISFLTEPSLYPIDTQEFTSKGRQDIHKRPPQKDMST